MKSDSDITGHVSLLSFAVLRGICTVGLFITETGLLLHTSSQYAAQRWEPRPRGRRASGPRHPGAARRRPAHHPDLTASRGKPASDALHWFLHLPTAPAPGVWPQLHVTGNVSVNIWLTYCHSPIVSSDYSDRKCTVQLEGSSSSVLGLLFMNKEQDVITAPAEVWCYKRTWKPLLLTAWVLG